MALQLTQVVERFLTLSQLDANVNKIDEIIRRVVVALPSLLIVVFGKFQTAALLLHTASHGIGHGTVGIGIHKTVDTVEGFRIVVVLLIEKCQTEGSIEVAGTRVNRF